jgi:hypothetical protein
MPPAIIVAKSGYATTILVLYAMQRVSATMLGFAVFDAVWVLLFVVAFVRTSEQAKRTIGADGRDRR